MSDSRKFANLAIEKARRMYVRGELEASEVVRIYREEYDAGRTPVQLAAIARGELPRESET